ncbi:MAG TPA: hypothetical protein VII99_07170 [Bacteroidia bacterium]
MASHKCEQHGGDTCIMPDHCTTDYKMLRQAFGEKYFILNFIKNCLAISGVREEYLRQLIEERDHFDILHYVRRLDSLQNAERFCPLQE